MSPIVNLFSDIIYKGLEYFGRHYSSYRAFVIDNNDPKGYGRLKLNIPHIHGKNPYNYWAYQKGCLSGPNYGFQAIPKIGDMVWVEFEFGDIKYPIWTYGHFSKSFGEEEKPTELKSKNLYWFKSFGGSTVILDDDNNQISIELNTGTKFIIKDDKISIRSSNINLGSEDTADEKSVLGETLQQQLNIERQRVSLIINALTTSAVASDNSGATYKANISAILATAQLPDYKDILSNTVKLNR